MRQQEGGQMTGGGVTPESGRWSWGGGGSQQLDVYYIMEKEQHSEAVVSALAL